MNTTNEPNIKDLEKNPEYYAAYTNLALHNVFITLRHLNTIYIGKKDVDKEEKVLELGIFEALKNKKVGNKSLLVSELDILQNKLQFHFPFLEMTVHSKVHNLEQDEQIGQDKLQQYSEILMTLISSLIQYRNFTTHALGGKPVFKEKIVKELNNIFDVAIDTIKDRFGYTPSELAHLVRYDRGKANYQGTTIRKESFKFHHSFYDETNQSLSKNGLNFLICIFLETRDSQLFLKKLYGFKRSGTKSEKATFHCYSVLHIRLPYDTISSVRSEETIAMDIINELRKAPSVLFDALIPQKQNQFRTKEEEDDIDVEPLLLRFQNRFAELALSYFDANETFKELRFAVHYGRFYYRSDSKTIINESINRWLTEDLYGFVRMNKVEEWKNNEHIKSLLKKTNELPKDQVMPYIQNREPQYLIQSNRILMSFKETQLPTVFQKKDTNYERPKNIFDIKGSFFISLHDFHNFVFYYLLTKNSVRVEGGIKEWIENFDKLKNDLASGKLKPQFESMDNERSSIVNPSNKLSPSFIEEYNHRKTQVAAILKKDYAPVEIEDIPDTWSDYLMGIRSFSLKQWQKTRLEQLRDEATHWIETYKKKEKHQKQSKERNIKGIQSGKLSEILAEDMIKMMKNEDKKPNSSEYLELQKTMAFWGLYKDAMSKTFRKMDLFNEIPYLNENMVKNSGIFTFFINYFTQKREFLDNLLHSLKDEDLYFLPKRNENLDLKQLQASNSNMDCPYALPHNFFAKKCVDFLKQDKKVSELLLEKFPEHQEFYDWDRTYELFDRWLDNRMGMKPTKSRGVQEVNLEQRQKTLKQIKEQLKTNTNLRNSNQRDMNPDKIRKLLKIVFEQEEVIRWDKAKDKLLFELAMLTIHSKAELDGLKNLSLRHIGPAPDQNIFNQFIRFELPYTTSSGQQKKIVDHQMKLKDYGKFKRLLKDKRLDGFLEWVDAPEIERSAVMKEWEEYEKNRIAVLEIILEFEKKCFEVDRAHFEMLKNEDQNRVVQHRPYLNWLEQKGVIDEKEKEVLSELRNRFCHNQYPDKKKVDIQPNQEESIIKQLADHTIKKYSNILLELNKNQQNGR